MSKVILETRKIKKGTCFSIIDPIGAHRDPMVILNQNSGNPCQVSPQPWLKSAYIGADLGHAGR